MNNLKNIIKEVVLQIKGYDAEVGPLEKNIDLLVSAKNLKKRKNKNDFIEDLVALNSQIYQIIGSRSAWEDIGERLLQTWGFNVPVQGGGEGVLTFWDVEKDGILYSVKTSLSKGPTKQGNFRFATQSSNIKFSSLVGAIKENKSSTRLGNIGCIYSEIGPTRIIQWGEVTAPISAQKLKKNIENLILAIESDNSTYIRDKFLNLAASSTGKKMTSSEMKDLKEVENHLSVLLSSGGRITGNLEDFLGPYSEKTIASIVTYEPEYFWNALNLRQTDISQKPEEMLRNKLVGRIQTISYGLTKPELIALLDYARQLSSDPDSLS